MTKQGTIGVKLKVQVKSATVTINTTYSTVMEIQHLYINVEVRYLQLTLPTLLAWKYSIFTLMYKRDKAFYFVT